MNAVIQIYVLKDPLDGRVRYVGKTSACLKKRLLGHLSKDNGNNQKKIWIKFLSLRGLKPIIESIELCNDLNWAERERFWINKYRLIYRDLLNIMDGGEPGNLEALKNWRESMTVEEYSDFCKKTFTEQRKIQHSISLKKRWDSPDERSRLISSRVNIWNKKNRLKNSLSSKQRWANPEYVKRVSLSQKMSWTDERRAAAAQRMLGNSYRKEMQ